MTTEHIFMYDEKGERFVTPDKAAISPYDHGVLYGDGVFEGIRVYHNRVFKLDEHIDRLFNSARQIELDIPLDKHTLAHRTVELCGKNKLSDSGYVRLVVTRGIGDLGLNPLKCPTPTIFIIAKSIQMYSEKAYRDGLEVLLADTYRISARSLSPNVKSLNYLNNILAKIEANKANCEEAIMRDTDGYIAECTGDNFFMVHADKVYTPTERAALKGITRGIVKDICLEQEIDFFETDIHPKDLCKKADECFLTGTAAEIVPVVKVKNAYLADNGRGTLTIGEGKPGQITKKILELYRQETMKPGNGRLISGPKSKL